MVYVCYALVWTGPDVIAVYNNIKDANECAEKMSPYVLVREEELNELSPDYWQSAYYKEFKEWTRCTSEISSTIQ